MAFASFQHADWDIALDPLSTNRCLHTDIPVIVAGPTSESVQIIIPDCTVPPVGNDDQIDLRHMVELRLRSPFYMGCELPPPDLALRLTPNSLEQTLHIQRRAYWDEINPLLERWRSVNDAHCPECACVIRGEYVASHAADPHYACVLLEMPGPILPSLVYERAEWQGPY